MTLAACGLIIGRPQPTTLRIAVGVAVLAAGVVLSGLLYLRWRRRSDATDAQVSAWKLWEVSGPQGPLDDEGELPDEKR